MKKILMGCCLISSLVACAQKEGRIVYERVFQLPVRTFRDMDPEIAKQIPKSRTDHYELLFANNQSLWQFLPDASNDGGDHTFGGGGTIIRFAGGNNDVSFHDLTKSTRLDYREVMERSFLVSDSISKLSWKLSDETKTILNHTCRKATSTRVSTRTQMTMENGEMKRTPIQDTAVVVAWYTTDIPVSVGPEYQGQLPGAVLELDFGNGQTLYKAIEYTPKVSTSKIKAPREGKKVTAAEFIKEREKLMEEMQKNMPPGSGMRIRMQ